MPSSELPPDVVAAIAAGRNIEAIKLLRSQWGISLSEAKLHVDTFELDLSLPVSHTTPANDDDLPEDVLAAIRSGQKLKAIKLLRQHRNLDLKVAKQIIDARFDPNPRPQQSGNPLITTAMAVALVAIAAGIVYGAVPRICVAGMGGGCVEDSEE
ncbi:MAG: hypothetical protein AB4050_18505 [Synechococcus sp.]